MRIRRMADTTFLPKTVSRFLIIDLTRDTLPLSLRPYVMTITRYKVENVTFPAIVSLQNTVGKRKQSKAIKLCWLIDKMINPGNNDYNNLLQV